MSAPRSVETPAELDELDRLVAVADRQVDARLRAIADELADTPSGLAEAQKDRWLRGEAP